MRIDWSIALGVLGILVSIAVGWITYVLANHRLREQRYKQTKGIILQELSKAVGEDNIPSRHVIAATIRSVMRDVGDRGMDEITVDAVLDDLMREVTSDSFLAADRRRALQVDIERVRVEATAQARESNLPVIEVTEHVVDLPALLAGIATGMGTVLVITTAVSDYYKGRLQSPFYAITTRLLAIFVGAMVLLFIFRMFAAELSFWTTVRRSHHKTDKPT